MIKLKVKSLFAKYRTWIAIGGMIFLYYGISPDVAILSFTLFWQCMTILGIVQVVHANNKVKQGQYVIGEVRSIKEERPREDFNYHIAIEFYSPTHGKTYNVDYATDSTPKKEYKVWIDESNPEKSIIVEDVHDKIGQLILLSLIAVSLFYVDFIYIKKILQEGI